MSLCTELSSSLSFVILYTWNAPWHMVNTCIIFTSCSCIIYLNVHPYFFFSVPLALFLRAIKKKTRRESGERGRIFETRKIFLSILSVSKVLMNHKTFLPFPTYDNFSLSVCRVIKDQDNDEKKKRRKKKRKNQFLVSFDFSHHMNCLLVPVAHFMLL